MVRTPAAGVKRASIINFRMTAREKGLAEKQAKARGFTDVSGYLRWLVHQDALRIVGEKRVS